MRRKSRDDSEEPILNVADELVALGPLRRDLLPLYQRWINDLGTMGLSPLLTTSEKEQDWYDRQSKTTCRLRSTRRRPCGPGARPAAARGV
jgi:hypothetical protein